MVTLTIIHCMLVDSDISTVHQHYGSDVDHYQYTDSMNHLNGLSELSSQLQSVLPF